MIAKNDDAHTKLAAELKDKKSLRKYWAIVHGNLPNDRGVIEAPIGRSEILYKIIFLGMIQILVVLGMMQKIISTF